MEELKKQPKGPVLGFLTDYRMGAALFCRGIGLIYLIAILSWWVQVDVLIGKDGLIPAQSLLDFLDRQWSQSPDASRWDLPTLFWIIGASDPAIHILCGLGCVFAILAMVGVLQGPALTGCWVIYLSFITTGDAFMSFQWDILLLESGIVAILLSSWKWRESLNSPPPLSLRRKLATILCWIVIGKLMFLSGWVKLAWASEAQPEWWPAHTAMTYHYQTQPLPTWTAWGMHQLPVWFHKFSIWPMYLIELVLPFFIIVGHRFRLIAAIGFTILMLLICLTGNYTFFNWLTICLCLPLVADRYWPGKWFTLGISGKKTAIWQSRTSIGFAVPACLILLLLNYQAIATSLNRAPKPLLKVDLSPNWLDRFAQHTAPFYLCSSYGLFRTMTTDRPEIILQGSHDGNQWHSYNFKWKPDPLDERPKFVAPHQPRVAWQLWFAALERRYTPRSRNSRWLESLVVKLLNGDRTVDPLFKENPFPDTPPKIIRAKLYLYEFTTFSELRHSGNWWSRKDAGIYLQEVQLSP